MNDYQCTEEIFLEDIKNHEMIILQDSGLYRHLRFKRKDSSAYYFDILTYPNHLVISGDMDCFVARRLEDMFQLYRTDGGYMLKDGRTLAINPPYWAEKIVSGKGDIKEFSVNKLKKLAQEYIDNSLYGEDWTEDEIQELKIDIDSEINYTDNNSVRLYDLMNEYKYYKEDTTYKDEPDFTFNDWWEYHSMCEEYTFHYIWQCYAIAYAVKEYDKFKQGETK